MKTRILVKDGEYKLSAAGCMDAKIDAVAAMMDAWVAYKLFKESFE